MRRRDSAEFLASHDETNTQTVIRINPKQILANAKKVQDGGNETLLNNNSHETKEHNSSLNQMSGYNLSSTQLSGYNLSSTQMSDYKTSHSQMSEMISCQICHEDFSSKRDFYHHSNSSHRDTISKTWHLCQDCIWFYPSKKSWRDHGCRMAKPLDLSVKSEQDLMPLDLSVKSEPYEEVK
jgi:hypothetical protein